MTAGPRFPILVDYRGEKTQHNRLQNVSSPNGRWERKVEIVGRRRLVTRTRCGEEVLSLPEQFHRGVYKGLWWCNGARCGGGGDGGGGGERE